MDAYTIIWDYAVDNFGVITARKAQELGVTKQHLVKMAERGMLTRLSRGVYLVKHHAAAANDVYAHSVAIVGEEAYLRGVSVVELLGLTPANPRAIYVGTPCRVRKRLPKELQVTDMRQCGCEQYQGINCQKLEDALATAVKEGQLECDRAAAAAAAAVARGLLDREAARRFMEK